jgi:glutaconyl-CoA/methylmalonyl-CoA decarboxylase subunit gamma
MKLTIGERSFEIELTADGVLVDGEAFRTSVDGVGGTRLVTVNGRPIRVDVESKGDGDARVSVDAQTYSVSLTGSARARSGPTTTRPAAREQARPQAAVKGAITAQMTGRVVRVAVQAGEAVASGDLLLILEAMKMENEIRAHRAGTVKEVRVTAGDRVNQGDALVVLED